MDLHVNLEVLQRTAEQEIGRLTARLERVVAQRHDLHNRIQSLQLEFAGATAAQQEILTLIDAQRRAAVDQETDLLCSAMREAADRVRTHLFNAESALALEKQRAELLRNSPALHNDWQEFQRFEAEKDEILGALPEFYRAQLLSSHEQLKRRLQPLVELTEQMKTDVSAAVPVECLLFCDQDTNEVALVIPVTLGEWSSDAGAEPILQPFVQQMFNAFFSLSKREDFGAVDLDLAQWHEFLAIYVLAEYRGYDHTEAAFKQALADTASRGLDAGFPCLQLSITSINKGAWRQGYAAYVALTQVAGEVVRTADPLPVESQVISVKEPSTIEPVIQQNEWYSADDLKSWARPVKVTADSKWNRSARQIRTLLIRMIGKGVIGPHQTAAELLWNCLPQPYQEPMRHAITGMIENGLLVTTGGDDVQTVSVNPTMLGEVEALINRTISPFWEDIIAS
jgi:hypothetical protein